MTSYEEWRVTGDPGEGFPPYTFTWSSVGPSAWEFPENEARNFVRLIQDHGGWPDGPHLLRRTVTVAEWESA